MSWNNRVVKRIYRDGPKNATIYAIHECYYDEKGKPEMITETLVAPIGETPEELRKAFDMQKEAFDKPVLNWDDF